MNIMIATPQYGGMCTTQYKRSCVNLENLLTRTGLPHSWLDTYNESLITRGRNVIAAIFLNSPADHLFFIDSDIEFTNEDAARLLTMAQEGVEVACGCYPTKKLHASFVAWKDSHLLNLDDLDDQDTPIDVDYAGTGFMLIKKSVFAKLQLAHPDWLYQEGKFAKEGTQVWAFFQDPIEDGIQLSEDFFFCKRAKEVDTRILIHPQVRLKHWGSHCFDGN